MYGRTPPDPSPYKGSIDTLHGVGSPRDLDVYLSSVTANLLLFYMDGESGVDFKIDIRIQMKMLLYCKGAGQGNGRGRWGRGKGWDRGRSRGRGYYRGWAGAKAGVGAGEWARSRIGVGQR